MTEPLGPDEYVAALRAAETEEDALKVEREAVQDTAEDDPGQVEEPQA